MTLAEQRSERREVGSDRILQRGHDLAHPLVLGDDVAKPAPRDLVDARGVCLRLRLGGAQRRRAVRADRRQRPFELEASVAVAAGLERVPHPGVEDDERDAGWQRDESVLLGPAVEQQRVPLAAEQRARRVHQPHRNADRESLGRLRDPGQLDARQLVRGSAREREADRHGQCRRRGHPCPDRDGGDDLAVQPGDRDAVLAEQPYHRGDVSAPALGRDRRRCMRRELDRIAEGGRPQADRRICRRGPRHRRPEIHGDRQDEPARVVGVLADQVDARRRDDGAAGRAWAHGVMVAAHA